MNWSWFVSGKAAGIAWIIALLSLAFSVFVWIESKATRSLTYRISEPRAAIVVSGQTSKLTVAFDGKPVTTDITAAQIAIWNAGALAAESSDIIKTVNIVSLNCPILDATLRGASREVVKPALDRSQIAKGIVGIHWAIMEHNDGFSVQLIYGGPANAELHIEGALKGQPEIEAITKRVSPITYPLLILLNFMTGAACALITWQALKQPPGAKRKLIIALLVVVFASVPFFAIQIYNRALVAPSNLTSWKADVTSGASGDF